MTTPIPRSRDSFVRRHWGKLSLAALLLVPALVFAIWSAVALTYSYSDGSRVGYNQKLSRKGWICKTWEGEIALSNVPGQAPELFQYSVRDDAVAEQIQQLEGARVVLSYEQHKGLPTSCFGETEYFATGVSRADDGTAGVPPVTPAAPAAPTAPPAGASPAAVPGTP
ncbi:MAG: hypothetical protein ACXW05_10490, partial [Gemmatirosa sp.]